MSEIEGVIRARQIQEEALAEINTKIQACQESIRNFEHLSRRIETLPDKMSYDVMVPFGKLAFMPGRLVHSNELLVHLGDAYFAGMTCKQSLKIVEMRQNNLNSTLVDLKKVAENIEAKRQYLGEMRGASGEKEKEIKEELTGHYTHPKDRKRISRIVKKKPHDSNELQRQHNTSAPKNVQPDQYAALMARLDQLEKLEEEDDEGSSLSEESDDAGNLSHPADAGRNKAPQRGVKHVRFREDRALSSEDDIPTIRFKHSKNVARNCEEMTPGDVHKLVNTQQGQPKAILKKPTFVTDFDAEPREFQVLKAAAASDIVMEHTSSEPMMNTNTSQAAAVSDVVMEHTSSEPMNDTLISVPTVSSRPISKFKASRMKR